MRTLRLALLLAIGMVPLFGLAYRLTVPGAIDPWQARAALVVVSLGILALTYRANTIRHRAGWVLGAYLLAIQAWFGALLYLNGLGADHALGYLFVFMASAMVYNLVDGQERAIGVCLGAAIAIGVGVAASVPQPETSPWVFTLCLFGAATMIYLVVFSRERARHERSMSEVTHEHAEALGATGSWSHDLEGGWRHWSPGMYRVMGLVPHGGRPPHVFDAVHPDDLSMVIADEEKLLSGSANRVDHTYRVVMPRGGVRQIHSIVTAERGLDGRVRSVFGVVLDVTEQAERERELSEAREEAEEAARLKAAILANMSHEIRTPLTAVIGYAQLLGDELGDLHRDLVEPIESGGRRLLDTLNSVLDLSRLEAGRMNLALVPVDALAEACEVASMLQGRAEARGLDLTVLGEPTEALADRAALSRVLVNLVSNAVKFTDDGGVQVRIEPDGDTVRLEVADTGRGIAPEFLPQLFEAFRQESDGEARSHEGSGLGLTITRRLVEAMDGTIRAESIPGVGSRFVVRLPAAHAEPTPEAAGAPPAGTAWISRPRETSRRTNPHALAASELVPSVPRPVDA